MRPVVKTRLQKRVAVVTSRCTGCAGSPVCWILCRFHALDRIPDPDNYPFYYMRVNPARCTGCGACTSNGTNGLKLNGCPWDAIDIRQQTPEDNLAATDLS